VGTQGSPCGPRHAACAASLGTYRNLAQASCDTLTTEHYARGRQPVEARQFPVRMCHRESLTGTRSTSAPAQRDRRNLTLLPMSGEGKVDLAACPCRGAGELAFRCEQLGQPWRYWSLRGGRRHGFSLAVVGVCYVTPC
jgi:hypothetical protein